MSQQYLSTDPNAGQAGGGYLSTDPNAGAQAEKPKAQAGPSGLQKAAQTFLDYVPNPLGIARGIRKMASAVTSPEALPTGGAMGGAATGASLGSTFGPVGTVAGGIIGAGVGGFLGKGGEIMAREARGEDAPKSPLADMATRGAGEAALQAGGGLVSKGARMAAEPVYNLGLGAMKSLKREYPNLARTGIDEVIAVSGRGADKAARLRTASRQQADSMIAAAEQAGAAPVSSREVVSGLRPVRDMARNLTAIGKRDETADIAGRAKKIRRAVPRTRGTAGTPEVQPTRITAPDLPDSVDAAVRANQQLGPMAGNIPTVVFGGDPVVVNAARQIGGAQANLVPRRLLGSEVQKGATLEFGGEGATAATASRELGIPLTRAQELKRTAQDAADMAFNAERKGNPITSLSSHDGFLSPEVDKAVARGLQKAIEKRVPEVAAVNSRTRDLGGLTSALEDAADRNQLMRMLLFPAATGVTSGLTTGDAGAGAGAAIGTAALVAPGNLSRAAIGMDRFGKWNLPVNAVRAAMLAAMAGDDK